MNKHHPGSCTGATRSKHAFVCMNNIELFLRACEKRGTARTALFEAADLYEQKNPAHVVKVRERCAVGTCTQTSLQVLLERFQRQPTPAPAPVARALPRPVMRENSPPPQPVRAMKRAEVPPSPRDDAVPPSPPISAVTPRSKQRSKAAARVLDKPALIRQPGFTTTGSGVALITPPRAKRTACADVPLLQGEALDSAVRM